MCVRTCTYIFMCTRMYVHIHVVMYGSNHQGNNYQVLLESINFGVNEINFCQSSLLIEKVMNLHAWDKCWLVPCSLA